MKRWAYVTAITLGKHGGQTTRVVESCRALACRRPTRLFAPVPPPELPPGVAYTQVALPAYPPREILFHTRLAQSIAAMPGSDKPDIIFCIAAAFNLGAIAAARRLGVPCVLELNGLPTVEYRLERGGPSASVRTLFYRLMEKIERRLVSGVVAVTPQLAAEALRDGARNVFVTQNGVDPQAFVPQDKQAARRELGLPADAEMVGFVGNFAAWQGLDALARGAGLLAEQRPKLHLLLIGDGVERPRLEALAAPLGARAHFAGRMPYSQVASALSACDVLAAPFAPIPRNLRMGISAIKLSEYLALGRPILGSRLPGMEFIANQGLGRLFRAGDADDLAVQLRRLLDAPPHERAAIAARSRAAAEGRFSWQQIADELIGFVEGLA